VTEGDLMARRRSLLGATIHLARDMRTRAGHRFPCSTPLTVTAVRRGGHQKTFTVAGAAGAPSFRAGYPPLIPTGKDTLMETLGMLERSKIVRCHKSEGADWYEILGTGSDGIPEGTGAEVRAVAKAILDRGASTAAYRRAVRVEGGVARFWSPRNTRAEFRDAGIVALAAADGLAAEILAMVSEEPRPGDGG
jgi:hypothetical protein